MGLDFDVLEFCKKVRIEKPAPYQCPLEKCDRVYKSICGLQYHLVNYDHDNPTPLTPAPTPNRKKGRFKTAVATGDIALQSPPREALTFAEAQKVVQFEIDGKISRISISEQLPVISLDEWTKQNAQLEKPLPFIEPTAEPHIKLPEASFKILTDYNICDAPPRPNAYIRFIEKSAEEMDGEVEYDVDEEDTAWLSIINQKRAKDNLTAVSVDTMELIMDRLEKESYFQAAQTGQHNGGVTVDEDAVCCICQDGECQNTNVILFCDMCNLAVHQDCYGVPYIPEGQWLCRRCLQSPSRGVACVLCPNTDGAMKQTDRGTWAHVVCALWIPEVRFANTVFLEPIDSIETIPPARWRLTCYICKKKGIGACIQCHRNNCYSAFHVTCAQHAGLYMKMDAVTSSGRSVGNSGATGDPSQPVHVAKMAYCDSHTPQHVLQERCSQVPHSSGGEEESPGKSTAARAALFAARLAARRQGREKMKQARRMLAMKRTTAPMVLVPTLAADSVAEIAELAGLGGPKSNPANAHLMKKLLAYWTLKRHYRNGAPLLRRLQSLTHVSNGNRSSLQEGAIDTRELCNQLKYWQRIRQDLERARLLCELVRKRERMKASLTRASERCLMHQLQPLQACLRKFLGLLRSKDTSDIFGEPVDPTEVPDYSSVVKHPMDLSTMFRKLDDGQYTSLEDIESDFHLMISNCLAYNSKDTVFYKAGIKMKEQGCILFRQARKELKEAGLIDDRSSSPEKVESLTASTPKKGKYRHSTSVIDTKVEKEEVTKDTEDEDVKPLAKMPGRPGRRGRSMGRTVSTTPVKSKKESITGKVGLEKRDIKTPPKEVTRLATPPAEKTPVKTSPFGKTTPEKSPSGVNRRTAVLFTRKAQAAAALNSSPPAANISQNESPILSNTSTATPSIFTDAALNTSTPPKKKGRGRPRKQPKNSDKAAADGAETGNSSSVPASFLVYRGPRGEAGSDSDAPRSRTRSTSSASSCSSCATYDDDEEDGLSRDNSCSGSSETEGSSYNETMDSTTNHTMSDNEAPLTRSGGKSHTPAGRGRSNSHPPSDSMRQWSTDQSESELSQVKGRGRPSRASKSAKKRGKGGNTGSGANHDLEPLQLVWAKCRGYPWYPALIIDPKIPKGFIHNGIPLPVPPQDVLNLKKNYPNEPLLYLVLFFDAKRTWQWLPPNKLEPLGLEKAIDQSKLIESRKPTERKAVKKAFSDAMQYKSQVAENLQIEKK